MTVTLTLGGVVFNGFEVPESINSGGEQMLVIHKLPGGNRVIDSMGPDDEDIKWSGRFRGKSAEERALLLDYMRRQGQKVLLTYSLHRYQVIIKDFKATFDQPFEIPYSITCAVVQDETQSIASAAIGFIESILMDVTNAVGLGNLIGSASISAAVTGVAAAVSNYQAGVPNVTNALTGLTAVAEAPLLTALQTAISGAQSVTMTAINTATATVSATPAVAGTAPSAIATALKNTASSMNSLFSLHQLKSTLGRMSINTSNAGS